MTNKTPSPEEVHLAAIEAAYQVIKEETSFDQNDQWLLIIGDIVGRYLEHVNEAFPDEVLRLPDSDNPCGVYFRSKQREAVYRIALGEKK